MSSFRLNSTLFSLGFFLHDNVYFAAVRFSRICKFCFLLDVYLSYLQHVSGQSKNQW